MAAQLLPRRSERAHKRIPLTILLKSQGEEIERGATTVDISKCGVRIRTSLPLTSGQTLDLFSSKRRVRLGHCRVVWVHPATSNQTDEAGLEILN